MNSAKTEAAEIRLTGNQPALAIELDQLTKRYDQLTAVDSLSLQVPKGTIFGFIGPNGAGKSTTIGCMTGLLEPTSGEVRLLGQRFTADSVDLKCRMGVMPEGLALFEQLHADEFLRFQGSLFGLDRQTARDRVQELLDAFELANTAGQCIADFSTGMRKRVAFAAAVIHGPELLFLDEPFESIDPATVAMLKEWLRQFVEQGRTVFMTSHVLETVEKLCDHVAIIKDGRLAWEAPINSTVTLHYDGETFATLEDLFLKITGRRGRALSWF